jgi:predicted site-specific integrase-resolvase
VKTVASLEPTGEFIGLREAAARFKLPYSSLRKYIREQRLEAFVTPSGRYWVRPEAVAALFQPVHAK